MIHGGCLCGAVAYEYSGAITEIAMCHCRQCRKAQGAAFVANAPIESARFVITKGQNYLKHFRSSADKVRVFCEICASPIYSAKDNMPHIKRLRIGTIDSEFHCANRYHIYTQDKAQGFDITDNYPQYKTAKP